METRFQPYAAAFLKHVKVVEDAIKHIEDCKIQDNDDNAQPWMKILEQGCDALHAMTQTLGLPVATDRFREVNWEMIGIGSLTGMKQCAKEALNALPVELKSIQFLPIGLESQKYIEAHFGPIVSKAFPDCVDDIEEAHTCFALGRYTASMFHLGRVMEAVTKLLGKKVKAAQPKKDDWQGWIMQINEVVNALPWRIPKQKEKRECLAEASNYLFNFKEAWRNKTMHPGRTFTQDQARVALQAAEAFLRSVAERIFKVQVSAP